MNGTDYRSALVGQMLQQIYHLCARMTVQTGGRLVQEHYRRIVDQLQGDRQPLSLAARQPFGQCHLMFVQAQQRKDLFNL